jgi:hypothetical protein
VPGFLLRGLKVHGRKQARPFSPHSKRPVQPSGAVTVVRAVHNSKGEAMKKMILAAAAAATLAAASLVAPAPANARNGGAVAAGVLGGLAAGAIIGGAAASAPPAYYGPGPAYVAGPPCYWRRERFWDGYGWRVRRVQICD